MFTRIARLAAGLWVFWGILILIGSYVGQQQPPVSPAALTDMGFSVCALPCWSGILPGETPIDRIEYHLWQSLPGLQFTRLAAGDRINFRMDNGVVGSVRYQQNIVAEIFISMQLQLDYLLQELAAPTCVRLVSDSQSGAVRGLILYWQQTDYTIRTLLMAEPKLALAYPSIPTQDLQIFALSRCSEAGTIKWIGFAPLWRYQALATQTAP